MSAYIVDRDHIAYLLEAAHNREIVGDKFHWYYRTTRCFNDTTCSPQNIGQMLWDENQRSVNHRYRLTETPLTYQEEEGDGIYRRRKIDPVQLLKAIDCYQYQCCEPTDWDETEAFAFTEALRHCATAALPGYEQAKWGAPPKRRESDYTGRGNQTGSVGQHQDRSDHRGHDAATL